MSLFLEQFSEKKDQPYVEGPEKTLLIASTPRCGSHMLGHALAETGHFGVPYEYCNPANLIEWQRRFGTATTAQTVQELMRNRTTPNGVFALKAHFSHTTQLDTPTALLSMLPDVKIVFIRRADILRQAISYAVAYQTGVWITGQKAVSDYAAYDAALIASCLDDIALQNAQWTSYFKRSGIPTCEVFYEAMTRDVEGTVTTIADFADIFLPKDSLVTKAPTKLQGKDARVQEWIERYFADRREYRHGLIDRARRKIKRHFKK